MEQSCFHASVFVLAALSQWKIWNYGLATVQNTQPKPSITDMDSWISISLLLCCQKWTGYTKVLTLQKKPREHWDHHSSFGVPYNLFKLFIWYITYIYIIIYTYIYICIIIYIYVYVLSYIYMITSCNMIWYTIFYGHILCPDLEDVKTCPDPTQIWCPSLPLLVKICRHPYMFFLNLQVFFDRFSLKSIPWNHVFYHMWWWIPNFAWFHQVPSPDVCL